MHPGCSLTPLIMQMCYYHFTLLGVPLSFGNVQFNDGSFGILVIVLFKIQGDRRLQWDREGDCSRVLQTRSIHHVSGAGRGRWALEGREIASHFCVQPELCVGFIHFCSASDCTCASPLRLNCCKQRKKWRNLPLMTNRSGSDLADRRS